MTTKPQEGFPTPDEIEGYWDWDKIHAPRPLTPLAGDAIVMSMGEGFTIAQHEFGTPLALKCRIINNYFYSSFTPDYTGITETPEELKSKYERMLSADAMHIGERWVNEWEPSLIPILERARKTDYSQLTDADLLAALEEQLQNLVYYWTIHGWINLVLVPSNALTDFYNENFTPEDSTESYELMQGYRTKSVEAAKGLWPLSRTVLANPDLKAVFENADPKDMEATLLASEEGRAFLADLHVFLEEFGWRSDGIYEIGDPTWREDVSIPLNTIQGYLSLSEDADPERTLARATARREELVARAREKLAGQPEKLKRFEELLDAAKYSLQVTEDHSYWIDQMGMSTFRHFALQFGARLGQKGLLGKADDVFFLYRDELRESMGNSVDMKMRVRERRADIKQWAQVVPPDHLGQPTPALDDPFFVSIVDKMLGLLPIEASSDPAVINGVAASPGAFTGTAKVVRTLVEASKLQQGDIMVCEMTVPTWVPLFATVSAVVADSGGILSHCAIVAREFNLPAVVGTRVGTTAIKDGMKITVDGTKGRVRIEAR
jgi:phosphohistidine swiveling domain-containing protein